MASGTPYLAALSGASKANRVIAEGLADRGHEVHVLCLARRAMRRGEDLAAFLDDIETMRIDVERAPPVYSFALAGVTVHAVDGGLNLPHVLAGVLESLDPHAVIVSSEDWRQSLLHIACRGDAGRVIYQARTITSLPFGPYAAERRPRSEPLLRGVGAIVAPCSYYAEYVEQSLGRPAAVIYNQFSVPPSHDVVTSRDPEVGEGRAPPLVTMINPCDLKGLSIFRALARDLADVQFGAVPLWGTSREVLGELRALPNVTVLEPTRDVDRIYERTRVLLAPSLWPEGISNTVVEALLRGIPVLASDLGGLREVLGRDSEWLLPVRPIEAFTVAGGVPVALSVPEQDIDPWRAALISLLTDPEHAAAVARKVRQQVLRLARRSAIDEYERLIASLAPAFTEDRGSPA